MPLLTVSFEVNSNSKSLRMSHTYPKRAINSLAVNPVSLKDVYHLENMEILAQNQEIGNFLYAVMTNPQAIKRRNQKVIILEDKVKKEEIIEV